MQEEQVVLLRASAKHTRLFTGNSGSGSIAPNIWDLLTQEYFSQHIGGLTFSPLDLGAWKT